MRLKFILANRAGLKISIILIPSVFSQFLAIFSLKIATGIYLSVIYMTIYYLESNSVK